MAGVSPDFFSPTGTLLDGFLLCLVSLPMEELSADLLLVLVIDRGVGAYLLACERATLAQKVAMRALARLAYFRVPSHDIA